MANSRATSVLLQGNLLKMLSVGLPTVAVLRSWRFGLLAWGLVLWLPMAVLAGSPGPRESARSDILLEKIEPDPRGGKAYKLVYRIEAPLSAYWRFKTDFDNDFLESSPFIRQHRLVSRSMAGAITENRYTHAPDDFFRWRTTLSPQQHRMDFVLLNPAEVRQKFHYGYIQLNALAQSTQVTQVAYFDFWGVSLWSAYPWGGGMTDFLTATARWEQKTMLRLKAHYQDPGPQNSD